MTPNPSTFTPRDAWPPGTVIKDDYVIESRLGKGGFGTVYKAKHRFLQSEHVIKKLHEEYSSDEEYVQKFIAEGQVIRRLKDCPFIVEVEHMTLTADQHLILIMEFMPGGDLNKLAEAQRFFTVAEVCGFAVQIAEGLRAAHAIELIHRDVKPHNVLLAANKRKAKLTDFGIAADHQNSKATSVVRGGSLGFAAPEQWTTSGRNLDGRTDIYSLGVTMYQMLTQCMPYAAVDIGGWIEMVRTTQPIHANKLREDIPPDLNQLVMQMIEVRREHRPPNVEAVLDALKPYADPSDWGRSATLRVPDRTIIAPSNEGRQQPPPSFSNQPPPSNTPLPPPPPPPPQYQQTAPERHPSNYTPTQFQPIPQHPSNQPPPYSNQPPPPYSNQPPPYSNQPPPYSNQSPGYSNQPPQYAGSLPQYNQLPSQPQPQAYQPQPLPQQPQWTPQTQPPPKGGAGKWLVIIPLVLALLGGGGWYGWKMYHPDSNTDGGGKQKEGGTGDGDVKTDWLKKGDEARDAGDFKEALRCYRQKPSGASRIPALQALVEKKAAQDVAQFSNVGDFDKADAAVDPWLTEFPTSTPLQELKATIKRRRENQ